MLNKAIHRRNLISDLKREIEREDAKIKKCMDSKKNLQKILNALEIKK